MSVFAVTGVAVIAAMTSVLLKKQNPELSLLISLTAGVIIILFVAGLISPEIGHITALAEQTGVSGRYTEILLKCLGICFIAQMASDSCRDAGESSLGNKIETAGKVTIAIMTLPMLEQLVETVISLIKM
ncbi:MAG: stage III sporulation protein AD [Clostridia bacterium]|nr:stage III sporulation protein AD [Clostridia bacterium]